MRRLKMAVSSIAHPGLKPLQNVNVVLVEDNEDIRESMTLLLEASGATVNAVGDAREALDLLEWLKPDIIMSDLGLPGESGITMIRKLRARGSDRGGDIPAIAVTAYADSLQESLAAGFQASFRKPADPRALIASIRKILGRD
jgi:CheY-like chemotaxis protein